MATVLEARNLTKRYWDFALEDLAFELPAGRISIRRWWDSKGT